MYRLSSFRPVQRALGTDHQTTNSNDIVERQRQTITPTVLYASKFWAGKATDCMCSVYTISAICIKDTGTAIDHIQAGR